ncbi:MAG TPA: riboflavin synthase [Bauldia sp.]|nr:riboflavin synthase [Bauldia sp.]
MFTGIVTDIGSVLGVTEGNDVRRISIASGYDPASIAIGASINCAGVCLTVIEVAAGKRGAVFDVEAAPETLRLTNAGQWQAGTRINLERALRAGDELGGHIVAGHVDGLAEILAVEEFGDTTRFGFRVPHEFAKLIAPKGSISLDGTSLTVNGVAGDEFDCHLIPHTLKVTTWGDRKVGDGVHFEIDTIARYVARLLQPV